MSVIVCQTCGSVRNGQDKFCPNCGSAAFAAQTQMTAGGYLMIIGAGCFAVLMLTAVISGLLGAKRQTLKTSPPISRFESPGSSTPPRAAYDGNIVTARSAALCGSTKSALNEMIKWAVKSDNQEMARVMLRTGSGLVKAGEKLKVLDAGFMQTKVRVISSDRECWVISETVR